MLQVTVEGIEKTPAPGTMISFISKLDMIKSFGNPGCFDYASRMLFEGVNARCNVRAEAITFSDSEKNTLMTMADRFRFRVGKAMDLAVPDESAIVKALITGDTSGITPELRDAFNRTGAGHLIAISGLNIGIIAAGSFWLAKYLLSFWPLLLKNGMLTRAASFAAIFPVVFYGLVSGLEPSALRAVIMACVFLAAGVISRENDILNTVAASAFIILAVMPGSLFSISFILSYMAVLFLILPSPVLDFIRSSIDRSEITGKTAYWLVQSLAVSFFATIGTAPFVMHFFGNFSPVGIPANLILVPLFGAIAVVPALSGVLFLPFTKAIFIIFIKIAAFPVKIGTAIIKFLSESSFSSFQTISPDLFETAIIYAILASGIILLNFHADRVKSRITIKTYRTIKKIFIISLVLFLADTVFSIKNRYFNTDLVIDILDVGHGNAVLVRFPYGKTLLVDGGGFQGKGRLDTGKDIVAPFLRRKKILELDYLALTHHDIDHIKGLDYIAQHFSPEEFWEGADDGESQLYENIIRSLVKNGTGIHDIYDLPEKTGISGVDIDFFRPDMRIYDKQLESSNDRSLVMRLRFKEKSILLTGDISEKAEAELIKTFPEKTRSDILLLPHHGSNHSGSDDFLDTVRPETGIISTGRKNFPGNHLLQRLEDRNIKIWRTDQSGCITVEINGTGYSVKSFREFKE